jgi:hypothetical protein
VQSRASLSSRVERDRRTKLGITASSNCGLMGLRANHTGASMIQGCSVHQLVGRPTIDILQRVMSSSGSLPLDALQATPPGAHSTSVERP